MKLEVGMYVRTKDGIEKITKKKESVTFSGYEKVITTDKNEYRNFLEYCEIKKASHDIIDLIEVGDYVNGFPVIHKENDILKCGLLVQFKENEIKSIVTKEQFEQMEYKVGE